MTEPGMIRNPDLVGHLLVRPSLWTVDTTKRVFSTLPPEGKCVEVIKRIFLSLTVVLVFLPSALLFCVGLPIKAIANCCASVDGSISEESEGPPQKTEAELRAEEQEKERIKKEKWEAYQAKVKASREAAQAAKKVDPKPRTAPPVKIPDVPAPIAPREIHKAEGTSNLSEALTRSQVNAKRRKAARRRAKGKGHANPRAKPRTDTASSKSKLKRPPKSKGTPRKKKGNSRTGTKTASKFKQEAREFTNLANRLKREVPYLVFEDNFMYLDIFLKSNNSQRIAICRASTEMNRRKKQEMLIDMEYLKLYAEGKISNDFLQTRTVSESYKYLGSDVDPTAILGKSMQVRGNGDCGLITFIFLLKIYGLLEEEKNPIELRRETIEWMKENWRTDPVLFRWILHGMDEYQQDLVGEIGAANASEALETKKRNKAALRLRREGLESQQALLAFTSEFWEHMRTTINDNGAVDAVGVQGLCTSTFGIPADQLDNAVSSYLDTFSRPQVYIGYDFVHALGCRFNITCEVVPVEQRRETETVVPKDPSRQVVLRPAFGDPQLYGETDDPEHHVYFIISGKHYTPFIPNDEYNRFFNPSASEDVEELPPIADGEEGAPPTESGDEKDDGKGVGPIEVVSS